MADRELDKIFAVLAKNMKLRGMNLVTQGRTFRVKATAGGVASFDFEEVGPQHAPFGVRACP
jgi:predicted ATPase